MKLSRTNIDIEQLAKKSEEQEIIKLKRKDIPEFKG